MAFYIIIIVCLITAAISSIFGLAGGAILFVTLTFFYETKKAIPLHAAIQFISNLSRLKIYIKNIDWNTTILYSILLIPGTWIGSWIYLRVSANYIELFIGIFIILSVFMPEFKYRSRARASILALGLISGILGMIVAVTGPLLTAVFSVNGLTKEKLIGTKSMCQSVSQLVKMFFFSTMIQFQFIEYWELLLIFGVAVIIGSILGKKILKLISTEKHKRLNNIILITIGSIMIIKSLYTVDFNHIWDYFST